MRAPQAETDGALQRARIGIGGGDEHLAELGTVRRDAHFLPPRAVPVGDPETEVVEQLVGEDDAAGGSSGRSATGEHGPRGVRDELLVDVAVDERPERLVGRLEREDLALLRAQHRRPFDEHVAQGREAVRVGPPDRANGPSRHRLRRRGTDRARRGPPPPVERATHAPNRGPISSGDEVPPGGRHRVRGRRTLHRRRERDVHEDVERDGALPPDDCRERVGGAHPIRTRARRPVRRSAGRCR